MAVLGLANEVGEGGRLAVLCVLLAAGALIASEVLARRARR